MTNTTKQTHTPGPWQLTMMLSNPHAHISGPNGKMVASIPTDSNLYKSWAAEGQANARLIAAAPELLEAAKALVDWSWTMRWADRENDTWKALDAAIAKAEGKVTP